MPRKNLGILFITGMTFFCRLSNAQSTETVLAYITRYKELAITEMKRSGIPAAITLAQGIHETEAGTSELVKKSNNHFGIKCKENWVGESVSHDDDARGECFRKYADPEQSYRDHSDFLRTKPNYAALFRLDPTDYEAWAYGLKKAGYATNPKYAQILIKLIHDYHLQDYTLMALGKLKPDDDLAANGSGGEQKDANNNIVATSQQQSPKGLARTADARISVNNDSPLPVAKAVEYPAGEFKINETRVIYVRKGTSYLTIAQQYEIPLARLFDFNDLREQEVAATDQLVFIQRKRKTGDHDFHIVQPGETLQSIAQTEAIRLESLMQYNNLGASSLPAVGDRLYLQSK